MSRKACKELIDNGGRLQGLAEALITTSKTSAISATTVGVPDTKAGEEWFERSAAFQRKAISVLNELNLEAMEICMSQPIPD